MNETEPPGTTRYDLIRGEDLEALAEVRSADAPVFSLYLDLRPERRTAEPPLTRFKTLLRQVEQRNPLDHQSRKYRKHWAEEVDRLRGWLETGRPLEGRGQALLSCQPAGLWRAFRLPVPVHDRLEVADRPYLRPLATLLDEFECYLAVLIDERTARLVRVRMGTAEEVTEVQNAPPPASGNAAGKPSQRHDTYLQRHARTVAELAETYWHEKGCDWLVTGGTEEALGELRDQLPKALRERIAGELHLSPQVELGQILDRVLEIEGENERQVEAERVEELITTAHKGGAAVLGVEATLLAVVEERVRLLIVEEEFTQAGRECPNCRFLTATEQEICPLCGTALSQQLDIVELALERVLEQDGDIEVLRSAESCQALEQYGRTGALLRYAYPQPEKEEEHDRPEQQDFEDDRLTGQDEIIDEALKETFPASDPPFWMPKGRERREDATPEGYH